MMKHWILALAFLPALASGEQMRVIFAEPDERMSGDELLAEDILGYHFECHFDRHFSRLAASVFLPRSALSIDRRRCAAASGSRYGFRISFRAEEGRCARGRYRAARGVWTADWEPGAAYWCRARTVDLEKRVSAWALGEPQPAVVPPRAREDEAPIAETITQVSDAGDP